MVYWASLNDSDNDVGYLSYVMLVLLFCHCSSIPVLLCCLLVSSLFLFVSIERFLFQLYYAREQLIIWFIKYYGQERGGSSSSFRFGHCVHPPVTTSYPCAALRRAKNPRRRFNNCQLCALDLVYVYAPPILRMCDHGGGTSFY